MFGHELAVEKREIADLEARDERSEGDLRGVGPAAEHALAEEGAAELHAIESADQLFVLPDFNRMRMARGVKRKHGFLELGIDPRLFAISAGGDHGRKIAVVTDAEPAQAERSPERARQVKSFDRNDRPVPRLDPEQLIRIAAVRHRENARGIALEQEAGVETTHGINLPSPSANAGGGETSQDFADSFLRPAQPDAIGRFHNRSLDQDRVLDHGIEDLVVGDVRTLQSKLFGERLLGA